MIQPPKQRFFYIPLFRGSDVYKRQFLDSEMAQLLCFDTDVDAETFCKKKSALFLVMPEEDPNKFFMVSLIIQQLYREILSVADEHGGRLPNRAVFYADEFGTRATRSQLKRLRAR